jgi:hypothetical protein
VTRSYRRGMWSWCLGAVSLLAVVGGALAGCASAPTPAAAVPPGVSARASASAPRSASASPSAAPSLTPTAGATPFVSASDEAGAYYFVKAYFAELNRAYASGDVARLKLFREPTCICVRTERLIVSTYAAGGE